jgi:flagellar motor switch protein FliN/FliY
VAQLLAKRIQEALAPPAPEPSVRHLTSGGPQPSRLRATVSSSPIGAPLPPRGIPVTPQVDVRPAEFMPLQQDLGAGVPGNLELILDIPVRVTVELGRTRKTIGEVLNMTPGSVVELEKMAGEPVDVLVNGKLMARGEVVGIDESFGIRITEIVSRAERIRAMGI